jgi:glutamate-ammonia-ligase adenylyltransferase
VEAERIPRGADPALHVKLGPGGLSDVEWTVQLLQLRHAHDHIGLQNTSTLEALDVVDAAGLVSATDVRILRDAWLTVTRARNALVLARGRPADQLPASGRTLAAIARICGYPDPGEFLNHYLRVTRRAKTVADEIFGRS